VCLRIADATRVSFRSSSLANSDSYSESCLFLARVTHSSINGLSTRCSTATTKAKLSRFLLPTYTSGAPGSLRSTTSYVLVLVSLNGKTLSEFYDFDEMVQGIKVAPEFCRWRFLFFPSAELQRTPSECFLGGLENASTNPTVEGFRIT